MKTMDKLSEDMIEAREEAREMREQSLREQDGANDNRLDEEPEQ